MEASQRITPFLKESIFEEMRALVSQGKMLNMCSGYTEWDPPQFLKDFLYQSTMQNENHYGRVGGQHTLVKAIARDYSAKFNREIDFEKEIVVTHGSTGALTNVCCAFLNEGDEVIILEPSFESYFVTPALFGGKLRTFPLGVPQEGSDEWTLDFEEFEKLFNEKSRLLILNTPHNPTGKVFKEDEIIKIIQLVQKYPRLIVVTDEVYEYMCYSGHAHLRIGGYKDMWEKVISIYTASKTFSISGWRIGWAIGSAKFIEPLTAAQTWLNLAINRPTQIAIAKALDHVTKAPYLDGKYYYDWLNSTLESKRDKVVGILKNCWLKIRVFVPDGGFFVLVDISEMIPLIPSKYYYKKKDYQDSDGESKKDYSTDYAFVQWMADKYKIVCVPCFPFYDQRHSNDVNEYRGSHLVRFALCKTEETLNAFAEALSKE